MENKEELLKELKPSFNFIYEIFMPTGKKIKSSMLVLIISVVVTIIVFLNQNTLENYTGRVIEHINIFSILKFICYMLMILSLVKLLVHIVFQKMQYNHISYKFYESYMIYEDDFLNQHKKNILYGNIKEVEIRRTIWDRIIGMGVIVVYTNAENKRNNGLVIYALKNPKEDYEFIDNLVNKYKKQLNDNHYTVHLEEENNNLKTKEVEEIKDESSFQESLKEINKN